MHMRMIDAPVVTTQRESRAAGWRSRAVEEHERSLPEERARLRTDLAARLLKLTGMPIPQENAYVDASGRLAVAGVEGETFRLYRQDGIVLVRPCDYCGTGMFESPKINDRADLGYALLDWRPLHEDCEDFEAPETLANW
jgi:hypothetical protein